MKPTKPPLHNVTFAEDQPEYIPLPAFKDPDAVVEVPVVTLWELSDDELNEVIKTKRIYLKMLTFGHPLQPVLLSVSPSEVYSEEQLNIINEQNPPTTVLEEKEYLSTAICDVCGKQSTWGGVIGGEKEAVCPICKRTTVHIFKPVPNQA